MTYRISIKTTIAGATEQMRESISAIAEHLAEIEENTPAFLGFSVLPTPRLLPLSLPCMWVKKTRMWQRLRRIRGWSLPLRLPENVLGAGRFSRILPNTSAYQHNPAGLSCLLRVDIRASRTRRSR